MKIPTPPKCILKNTSTTRILNMVSMPKCGVKNLHVTSSDPKRQRRFTVLDISYLHTTLKIQSIFWEGDNNILGMADHLTCPILNMKKVLVLI